MAELKSEELVQALEASTIDENKDISATQGLCTFLG